MKRARNIEFVLLFFSLAMALPSAVAQVVVATVAVGSNPHGVAVNATTNKIYVPNYADGTVTVIDGATNTVIKTVPNVGVEPDAVAVNSVTNKTYVANNCGSDKTCGSAGTVAVIDANNNYSTVSVPVGYFPIALAVNSTTNRIYVVNSCGNDFECLSAGTVTVIDGGTNTVVTTVTVEYSPEAVAVNAVSNKVYVANNCGDGGPVCISAGTVTVIDGAGNGVAATVDVGFYPNDLDLNSATNKVYVSDCGNDGNCTSPTVTVIDANNNYNTVSVPVGYLPVALAVNSSTNQIYVSNYYGNDPKGKSAGTVTVIDANNNDNTATVNVAYYPGNLAIASMTNEIYVLNSCGNDPSCSSPGTVTVIDGATNSTVSVAVGNDPSAVAVNAATNTVYVVNRTDATVSVISGATQSYNLTVSTTGRGTVTSTDGFINCPGTCSHYYPQNTQVTLNATPAQGWTFTGWSGACSGTGSCVVTMTQDLSAAATFTQNVVNYTLTVSTYGGGTVTSTDGFINCPGTCSHLYPQNTPVTLNATPASGWSFFGWSGACSGTGSCMVTMTQNLSVGATFTGSVALQFVPVTPCRLVDTRNPAGEFGGPPLQGKMVRSFAIPDNKTCNIPATAAAYSLNVTVVPHGILGYLTMWPTGQSQPLVSTLNSYDGRVKANAAIVPAGTQGAISFYVSNTTDLVLDIDGYFAPVGQSTLAFYPLAPCRVADTRNKNGDLGGPYLKGGVPRAFPILEATSCGIPNTAQAYSLNFTVAPFAGLGYLTVWPTGQQQPLVSTLNSYGGQVIANAAIVPAGSGAEISAYASNNTHLIIDINGYFAPAGQGGLSLYPVAPCRVLDTRNGKGAFTGTLSPPVDVVGSACSVPAQSEAYVFNATVVPSGSLGYLTLWPYGSSQPLVSTLNAYDGAVSSNMAIVPAGTQGKVNAYAQGLTNLILDISSYFGP